MKYIRKQSTGGWMKWRYEWGWGVYI